MSHSGPILAIIVPTFNEVDNVGRLVSELIDVLKDIEWEVIFVDDNSPDGTATKVRRISHSESRVRCVHRIGRRGLSTACIEGMLASSAPYLVVMDCDLQHDPAILNEMFRLLMDDEADVVIGSRYIEGGGCGAWSKRRYRISRAATLIGRWVLSADLKDPMSNFFGMRREVFDEAAAGLSGLSFKILLDILMTVRRPLRLRELPFVLGERQAGNSKFEVVVAWEFMMLLADKTIGSYIPVRLLALMTSGAILAISHLAMFALAHSVLGIGFVAAGALSATLSMTISYAISNVVTYRDRQKHGIRWFAGLAYFMTICSIGAATNVIFAGYLFNRGVDWFLAALVGVLLWLAWNLTAMSSYVWGLGKQFAAQTARPTSGILRGSEPDQKSDPSGEMNAW
ncbi:glycosyltransferase [Steroidobacter flavus]|uniref:Glycosyltransferase n=1 Tax=Steroidobacter flavus TaxID=1842136 RepID=A0ABV8SZD6_9GAMM